MQGAFAEHIRALEKSGAHTRLVRTPEDLEGLDGIVLPGGESTTMTMLMERTGLLEPLRDAISQGLATLATCAGMIVLARDAQLRARMGMYGHEKARRYAWDVVASQVIEVYEEAREAARDAARQPEERHVHNAV